MVITLTSTPYLDTAFIVCTEAGFGQAFSYMYFPIYSAYTAKGSHFVFLFIFISIQEISEDVLLAKRSHFVFVFVFLISIQEISEDVLLMEVMYLVFTRMPGESYRRRLRSLLLYLCYVFRALINNPPLAVHPQIFPEY